MPTVAERREMPSGPAAPVKGKRPLRRAVLLAVLLGGVGFGGYEAYGYWTNGRFMVSTDDAYVQADITVLSAKVSGYVAEVPVENNQAVKAGDVIARIDAGDYRLAVRAARDKLATQQAAIERLARQADAGRAGVQQAMAQLDAARADAERAAGELQRQSQLGQSGYSTAARLEQVRADQQRSAATVAGAEAALAAAHANVDVLTAQGAEAERVAAEYKTAVDRAERDLSFTEIRAPVDGVVGNRAVEVGSYVQPGARLAAVVPLTTVHIDANFKETQMGSLHPGQRVRLEIDALPGREIEGRVESVAPASGSVFSLLPPENATGNFTKIVQRVPVRIAIPDDVANERLLRPGLSAVVRVDSRDAGSAEAAAPRRAVAQAPASTQTDATDGPPVARKHKP
ncbi:HlyD family secretion protein [Salinarimonas soli]|uniref:HlyD family secretion protein n=1 Tax=Salinarimonas soli TaxID=1638099 RepID=A0A5B2VA34_9HYPH|nr:HlyD family secretion protein [Salinarimonas soli]